MLLTLIKTVNSPLIVERPEIELLLCCARSQVDEKTNIKIKNLVEKDLDWKLLLEYAQKHKILSLLFFNINKICPQSIPIDILEIFRSSFYKTTQKNLLLVSQLLKIIHNFQSNQIDAISLKGPVLAYYAYGDLGLRTVNDLDILVEKKNFLKAQQLLIESQYQPSHLNNPSYYQQAQFYQLNNSVCIDLHYEFAPINSFVSVDSRIFWNNLQSISIGGKQINILAIENLILYLCLEGSKEYWRRLNRLCDVAELLENNNFDWKLLLEQANKVDKLEVLFLALFLAKKILNVSIPNEIWELVENSLNIKPSIAQINKFLFSQKFDWKLAIQWHLFNLQAFPSISKKSKYCWQVIKVNYRVRTRRKVSKKL